MSEYYLHDSNPWHAEEMPEIHEHDTDDTISRQAAIRWVKKECNPYGKPTLDYDSGLKVIEHLKKMPSAQSERPKGEWIFNPKDAIDSMFAKPKCPECGFESADGGNFCSNCGADLRGDKERRRYNHASEGNKEQKCGDQNEADRI